MQINLIAIGNRMPAWVNAGFVDYAARLPPEYRLKLIEIPAQKRLKNTNIPKILELEGEQLLAAVPKDDLIIALERTGKPIDTLKLAENLRKWNTEYHSISLLIGGPEGIAQRCLDKANEIWSLSKLTFPHSLVRVIVAEQIYRSWSILKNHPYHR
jgi:23S rRNA (pseudouridine1915-N3)-methyltransferase